jgi:hypothetical protein
MMVTTEQINIFVMGMVTASIIWGIYKIVIGVIHGYPVRMSESKINTTIDRLQRQGFKVYQAIIGRSEMTFEQAKDATLLKAQGYLVFSDKDAFAGILLRPRLTSSETAQIRRSQFKLVVSNEPNE